MTLRPSFKESPDEISFSHIQEQEILQGMNTGEWGSGEPSFNYGYHKGRQVEGHFAQKGSTGVGTCLQPGESPCFFFPAGR